MSLETEMRIDELAAKDSRILELEVTVDELNRQLEVEYVHNAWQYARLREFYDAEEEEDEDA